MKASLLWALISTYCSKVHLCFICWRIVSIVYTLETTRRQEKLGVYLCVMWLLLFSHIRGRKSSLPLYFPQVVEISVIAVVSSYSLPCKFTSVQEEISAIIVHFCHTFYPRNSHTMHWIDFSVSRFHCNAWDITPQQTMNWCFNRYFSSDVLCWI